jgi:hypothetical protein
MKRVITISYTVDSTDAKTIGRLVSPLIFKGLYGLDLSEPLTVENTSVANEPVDNCPIHDAFEAAGLELEAKREVTSQDKNTTLETDSTKLAKRYEHARQEQSEARRELEERRRWLLNEFAIVEKAIASNFALDQTNLSVAELTRHVLACYPQGASSRAIVRGVQATRPNTDRRAVHAALRYERKTGTRRNHLYFPPEGS